MPSENAINVSGRLKRWLGRGLLGLLVLVVTGAAVGASYQAIENSADARRFPQQGTSVSLGPAFDNLTLNLDCRGQGGPTVILDSGLGVPAIGWNPVQTEVAKFTRVCSYDRAGYGWSSASLVSAHQPADCERTSRFAGGGARTRPVHFGGSFLRRLTTCAFITVSTRPRLPAWCWWMLRTRTK